jgi:hypothetical protein
MFEYTCKLESLIRYKDKDIDRLSYLNQYLTESQKKRDEIILESQKEIQRLKQLIILYEKKASDDNKKDFKELTMTTLSHDLDGPLGSSFRNNQGKAKLPSSRPPTNRTLDSAIKIKNQSENKPAQSRLSKVAGMRCSPDLRGIDGPQFMMDSLANEKKKNKIPQNRVVKPIGKLQ